MPGKRPRQIQRTKSMSQLGGCGGSLICVKFTPVTTVATAQERFGEGGSPTIVAGKNAFCSREVSPPCRQEDSPFYENMEVSNGAALSTSEIGTETIQNEDNSQSMAIDAIAEESLSHTNMTMAYNLFNQTPHLGYSPQSFQNRSMGFQSRFYREETMGSVQPAHFLDVCFLCMKRLGHGRDTFIYRGDRAFCSEECRHHQIAADERREKCRLTAIKKGVGITTPSGNPSSTTGQHVETAAAA